MPTAGILLNRSSFLKCLTLFPPFPLLFLFLSCIFHLRCCFLPIFQRQYTGSLPYCSIVSMVPGIIFPRPKSLFEAIPFVHQGLSQTKGCPTGSWNPTTLVCRLEISHKGVRQSVPLTQLPGIDPYLWEQLELVSKIQELHSHAVLYLLPVMRTLPGTTGEVEVDE